MLLSNCRNFESEKSNFLGNIDTWSWDLIVLSKPPNSWLHRSPGTWFHVGLIKNRILRLPLTGFVEILHGGFSGGLKIALKLKNVRKYWYFLPTRKFEWIHLAQSVLNAWSPKCSLGCHQCVRSLDDQLSKWFCWCQLHQQKRILLMQFDFVDVTSFWDFFLKM